MHERIGVPMARPEPPAMLRERAGNVPLRRAAISVLLAAEATSDVEVSAFRRDVLRGKLLDAERVGTWLRSRSSKGGPPWELLGYAVSGSSWPHFIKVSASGPLNRLREISERLAYNLSWQPAEGTNFVLTGSVPLISTFRVEYRLRQPAAASRLTLTVDPSLPPAEVAKRYARARRAILSNRSRVLSDKHLHLGIFAAQWPEGPWKRAMGAWNKQFPGWKYSQETNFARDASQARERLLHPPFHPYPRA